MKKCVILGSYFRFSCMKSHNKQIALIIPAYNESRHIGAFFDQLSELDDLSVEVVFVDDGSSDNSSKIAAMYTQYVLTHVINLGKGAALKTGCEFAFNNLGVDFIIMLDADEQHSPNDLPKFIKKITEGHDLILGVRSFTGMPFLPKISNKFTSLFIKIIYGTTVPDIPSGYKAFSKKMYQKLKWQASGYEVEVEIAQKIAHSKLPFVTVPIKTIYPDYVRGMTLLDGVKVLLKSVGLR